MTDKNSNQQGDSPIDNDELVGDRAEIDRATTKKVLKPDELDSGDESNPPRTTTGRFTAPKFGSAGGGGAELEPGPEKD
jgi:hypothetical protein